MTEQDKVTVDDIISIVKTEEQTNSVEEVRKLRGRGNETAKRFSVTQTILGSGIYDYQAEDELCESYDEDAYGEVCNLLNELHEENQSSKEFIEQLQEELVLFKNAGADMGIDLNNQITALKKENEQLKTTIQQLTNDNTKQKKKLNTAMKENEELKSLIKALKKSNADFINQIRKAYDEDLSVKELADNCGIEIKGD